MAIHKIAPFLWYATEAEEAAHFYASIFPDSRVTRVTALPSESPSGPPGSVKVVEFELFGQPFTAMSAGPLDQFNHSISLFVTCEDQAEIDRYWDGLLAGGGPFRSQLADRAGRARRDDGGSRSRPGQARFRRDAEDGQVRHRGTRGRVRGHCCLAQPHRSCCSPLPPSSARIE